MSEVQAVQLVLAGELLEVRAHLFAGECDGEGDFVLAGAVGMRAVLTAGVILVCSWTLAQAREGDDHGNHGALKPWFDQLASKKGLCCSFADGVTVEDVDWDTQEGHYRVRLHGEWVIVPDNALITEPNRFGPAVVWPYYESGTGVGIRCFIPGAGT